MDQDRQSALESFKQMSFGEKVGHIVRYHGWKVIAAGVVLFFIISFIGRFTFAKEKESCLGIAIHGTYMDPDVIDTLPVHFTDLFYDMTEEGEKVFRVYQFYNGYSAAEAEERTATIYRMAASIQTQMLDVIIGDEEALSFDAGSGYLIDLREVFTEEELKMIREKADRLSKDEQSGILVRDIAVTGDTGRIISTQKDIPLMICLRGADSIIDESLASRPVYIGIVTNTPNLDNAKAFILELLGN